MWALATGRKKQCLYALVGWLYLQGIRYGYDNDGIEGGALVALGAPLAATGFALSQLVEPDTLLLAFRHPFFAFQYFNFLLFGDTVDTDA